MFIINTRAMKGEVDQLHKKISLGLRHGFSDSPVKIAKNAYVT
jgi:hypothetical protein